MDRTPAWLYGAEGTTDLVEEEAEKTSSLKDKILSVLGWSALVLAFVGVLVIGVKVALSQQPPMPPNLGPQAGPRPGSPACGTRADILEGFEKNYHETLAAVGVLPGGGLFQVLVAPDGTTFTVVVTRPHDGMTCVTAVGENWESLPLKAPEEPASWSGSL